MSLACIDMASCRGISAATYGTGWSLAGSAGGHRVAQREDQRTAARQRGHEQFTQGRATATRKTLLLLWWIDDGMNVVVHSTLARQGLPQGCRDYARMVAWVHQLSNPLTPPTSTMGLFYRLRGHHSGKVVIIH